MSYKRLSLYQRVVAMHYSDMINVKSRFEILFNARVDDIIKYNNY